MIHAILILLLTIPSLGVADTSTSVFRFQQKMAERGHAQAQYKLAMMYETGSGVNKNMVSASVWYRLAATQNYKPAKHRLTYLTIQQNGFDKEHEAWLKNLKRDAVYGDGEALFLLGQMHAQGIGVKKDLKKSISILKKATGANVLASESELLRVQAEYQKQLAAQNKKPVKKAVQAKPQLSEKQKQKLREQRLQRLEKKRIVRQQKLLAEQQRKLAEKRRQLQNQP
ncbi:MAG: SEL1-like repeat protein, partial [Gammaproteobacteria bacterium]|nr:SEL1-like repeat protein [Gammaproteobacteria bacterium]